MFGTTSGFADGKSATSPIVSRWNKLQPCCFCGTLGVWSKSKTDEKRRALFKSKKEPSKGSFNNGGNDEARTRDLMRDRHAL